MRSEGYCSCPCPSVCPLVGNSLVKHLFILKTLSHTQRAMKVKKICGDFSESRPFRRLSAPSIGWPYIKADFPRKVGMHIAAYEHAMAPTPISSLCGSGDSCILWVVQLRRQYKESAILHAVN